MGNKSGGETTLIVALCLGTLAVVSFVVTRADERVDPTAARRDETASSKPGAGSLKAMLAELELAIFIDEDDERYWDLQERRREILTELKARRNPIAAEGIGEILAERDRIVAEHRAAVAGLRTRLPTEAQEADWTEDEVDANREMQQRWQVVDNLCEITDVLAVYRRLRGEAAPLTPSIVETSRSSYANERTSRTSVSAVGPSFTGWSQWPQLPVWHLAIRNDDPSGRRLDYSEEEWTVSIRRAATGEKFPKLQSRGQKLARIIHGVSGFGLSSIHGALWVVRRVCWARTCDC